MRRIAAGSLVVHLAFGMAIAQVSDPDAVTRRARRAERQTTAP